jgi:hypothetical protein
MSELRQDHTTGAWFIIATVHVRLRLEPTSHVPRSGTVARGKADRSRDEFQNNSSDILTPALANLISNIRT